MIFNIDIHQETNTNPTSDQPYSRSLYSSSLTAGLFYSYSRSLDSYNDIYQETNTNPASDQPYNHARIPAKPLSRASGSGIETRSSRVAAEVEALKEQLRQRQLMLDEVSLGLV